MRGPLSLLAMTFFIIIIIMKIGIIGLPLSGKSSVFNALTGLHAEVKEFSASGRAKPNLGTAKIPDERLEKLAQTFNSKKTTYASIDFVDMTGISKDTKAENIDLSSIKDSDAFVVVVRFFRNDSVSHPYNTVDGVRDLEIINTSLILLDLNIAEGRVDRIEKEIKKGRKTDQKEHDILKKCQECLLKEKSLRELKFTDEEDALLRGFQFLSKKPILALANIDEAGIAQGTPGAFIELAGKLNMPHIAFCAKTEAEMAQLDDAELKTSFMQELGITETARNKFIKASFSLLNLITFYTGYGGQEARAWLVDKNATAYEAAGKIHSDIQRGFIRAELINFKDLMNCNFDIHDAKAKSLFRLEGKDHIVKDGDIALFRFSV